MGDITALALEKSVRAKEALDNPVLMEIVNRNITEAIEAFINSEVPVNDLEFDLEKWGYKLLAARMKLEAAGKIKEELTMAHQGYANQLAVESMVKDQPNGI